MVDPVSTRPVTLGRSVAPLAKASHVAAPRSAVDAGSDAAAATGIGALVADYAATPPVDLDRVAKIRHAIETNSYPIIAETVADRLIAIKLNWKPQ